MGTFFVVAITIFVIALGAAGFFWAAYHTMHFDLPNMFKGAVLVLIALAIASAVLGFTLPLLAVMLL